MILSKRADADRFLGAPTRDVRACLIYGRDRGGVRERADRLAGKVVARPDDPFDTALLTDSDLDADAVRLADELSALSMLGGRRLVRLRLSTEKAGPDRIAAEAFARHVEGAYNPDCFLIVEGGALGRDSALRKAAEAAKAGAVVIPVYEDEVGDTARFIKEALTAETLRLTPPALDALASRLPKERGVARQEIERLILFLGPGSGITADLDDLTDFFGVEPEASLSDAASDAFGGRLEGALSGLRRAFAEGEAGVAAVRAAGMHQQKLRRIGVLTRSGKPPEVAAKQSGVFWKQEREVLRQVRAWTGEALDAVQAQTLDADLACKRAASPDVMLAERLFLNIAGRARRLGL